LWNGGPAWLATRYKDVRAILRNHAQISSDTSRPGFPQSSATAASMREQQKVFVRMDPPKHDEHRLMLTADFMVKHVRELRPFLDDLLEERFTAMEELPKPVALAHLLAG